MRITILFLFVWITFTNCNSPKNSAATASKNAVIISDVTTNQTRLSKKDVINYFCSNLTEYFNTYKYYKISSEVYSEKARQNSNSTSKITKRGSIYDVEYIGSAGEYTISFSNSEFSGFESIGTFVRNTIIGNANRKKVYDTFSAWLNTVEISLKANDNTYLYTDELNAALELEKWYNNLN
jgi:hypothetical protein